VNIALLRMLQTRPDSYSWPDSIARSLQVSPAGLLRDLNELEEFGFGIEQIPNRGIRLTEPARRLCVDQIEWELDTKIIGRRIAVWKRVGSTNDVAARAAKSPSNDGLVVLAEHQTAGRGRRHRRWHAPPHSSILMSVLIFPPDPVRNIALLTSLAAVAVADVVIESLDLPARIKWPNDVRVRGLKVCGILVEDIARGRAKAAKRRAAVIGIGVNVNIAADEFPAKLDRPATSLMILCGRRLDRSEFVRSLVERLDHYYHLALRGDSDPMWHRWRSLADLIGQRVRVQRPVGELCGDLIDLFPPRGVSLRIASGEVLNLPAEEVTSIAELC
jgi:BirA family biotin operon repressor/biotin-[acetyl-CoA-carboxylase] ligase